MKRQEPSHNTIMDKQGYQIRTLRIDDLSEDLLNHYNRYQVVTKVWRVEDHKKIIKDIGFIEDWDDDQKQNIIFGDLKDTLDNGGSVFGVYEGNTLKGFASISGTLIGNSNEYLQLLQLHVSSDRRGKGLGQMLFSVCIEKAKGLGASKLYISSHSSLETHRFYTKMGCVDATWLYEEQVALEPCDCQLEYVL